MKEYNYTVTDGKKIEVIVNESIVMINHIVLPSGDRLPEHNANSNVYMIVADGTISIKLGDNNEAEFSKGSIINIDYGTLMNVVNKSKSRVELFIVKAPGPDSYRA